MSKYSEELKGLLGVLGIDPESIEIHECSPIGMQHCMGPFKEIMESAKAAGYTAENIAKDMSNDIMASYLQHMGLSEERINEIMKEAEENKKKEVEAAKAAKKNREMVSNHVVEMTMKSIANIFGYDIANAVIRNGIPEVEKIEKQDMHTTPFEPAITFDMTTGFQIHPNSTPVAGHEMDAYVSVMNNAVNLCKALNRIDYRTWPNIEN